MTIPLNRLTLLSKISLALYCYLTFAPNSLADQVNTVDLMRNISFSYLRNDFTLTEITQFILYPPKLITDMEPIHDQASFTNTESQLQKISNLDLYKLSQEKLFSYVDDPDKFLHARKQPLTIVLIPGIFGEFINNRPFESVLSKESVFSKKWQKKLAALEGSAQLGKVFNFKEMRVIEIPIQELVSASSIDSSDGHELVRLIYLKPLFGSLETLGNIASKRSIYQRRLSKVFSILGLPERIYLMGYSQGANVALDFVSDLAQKAKLYPWVENIKGVISLGGVLFGSELSNMARDPGELSYKLIAKLSDLATELEDSPSNWLKIPAVVSRNSLKWKDMLLYLKKIGASFPEVETPPQSPNFELAGIYQLLIKIVTQNFELQYTKSYFKNIRRFKLFIKEAKAAIFGMTTAKRIEWWQKNLLPTWVQYYAISGSMPDPNTDNQTISPLINHMSYGAHTVDYRLLVPSYLDIFRRTQMKLNDSQVAIHQTLFWPRFHQKLNPLQGDYQANYLGVLGSHHWGFAFPFAFKSEEYTENPYPRSVILRSIAASIAYLELHQ